MKMAELNITGHLIDSVYKIVILDGAVLTGDIVVGMVSAFDEQKIQVSAITIGGRVYDKAAPGSIISFPARVIPGFNNEGERELWLKSLIGRKLIFQ